MECWLPSKPLTAEYNSTSLYPNDFLIIAHAWGNYHFSELWTRKFFPFSFCYLNVWAPPKLNFLKEKKKRVYEPITDRDPCVISANQPFTQAHNYLSSQTLRLTNTRLGNGWVWMLRALFSSSQHWSQAIFIFVPICLFSTYGQSELHQNTRYCPAQINKHLPNA